MRNWTIGKSAMSTDTDGYTRAFTWWRNTNNRLVWSVCGLEDGFTTMLCKAVVDDFGNLVRVS